MNLGIIKEDTFAFQSCEWTQIDNAFYQAANSFRSLPSLINLYTVEVSDYSCLWNFLEKVCNFRVASNCYILKEAQKKLVPNLLEIVTRASPVCNFVEDLRNRIRRVADDTEIPINDEILCENVGLLDFGISTLNTLVCSCRWIHFHITNGTYDITLDGLNQRLESISRYSNLHSPNLDHLRQKYCLNDESIFFKKSFLSLNLIYEMLGYNPKNILKFMLLSKSWEKRLQENCDFLQHLVEELYGISVRDKTFQQILKQFPYYMTTLVPVFDPTMPVIHLINKKNQVLFNDIKLEYQIFFEGTSITKLPFGEYMLTGGYTVGPHRETLKKDWATLIKSDYSIWPLPNMVKCHFNHCSVFHKGYVYVFGKRNVERFSKCRRGWEFLEPMPGSRIGSHCASFGQNIIIADQSSVWFVYNPEENYYSEVDLGPHDRIHKIVVPYNDTLYIIFQYWSSSKRLDLWSKIEHDENPETNSTTDFQFYKHFVYAGSFKPYSTISLYGDEVSYYGYRNTCSTINMQEDNWTSDESQITHELEHRDFAHYLRFRDLLEMEFPDIRYTDLPFDQWTFGS